MSVETMGPDQESTMLPVQIEAELAQRSLEQGAVRAGDRAADRITKEGDTINAPGTAMVGSLESTQRTGDGNLAVTESSITVPSLVPSEIGFGRANRSTELSTTESIAPADGLIGKIFGKPDKSAIEVVRASAVRTPSNPYPSAVQLARAERGEVPAGAETSFTETVNGTRRDVQRTVKVGSDNEGQPVIQVEQTSTDKAGNNPRVNRWTHTSSSPSRAAVRTANTVGARVIRAQPKQPDTEIRM